MKKRRRKRAKAKKSVISKISDQSNQDFACKESMEKPASDIPTRARHHPELTNVRMLLLARVQAVVSQSLHLLPLILHHLLPNLKMKWI